jgi:hypothetical protein
MSVPPQHVIRFYGNPEYAVECLGFKQIAFLHVDKLNDPFDPNTAFETDFNEDYQALIDYVQHHHLKDFQKFQRLCPWERWEGIIKGMDRLFTNHRNSLFMFSTSEVTKDSHPNDNLYMWSHYGNGHRGIAIEFDTNLLTRTILREQEIFGGAEIDANALLCEIFYQEDLPLITCEQIFQFVIQDTPVKDEEALMKTELADIIKKRVSMKSMIWKTEKEWRFMKRNDETGLKIQRVDLLDGTITAVYTGLRYQLHDDHGNDPVILETKRNFPKAKIYKAKKMKGKFALDFERIF